MKSLPLQMTLCREIFHRDCASEETKWRKRFRKENHKRRNFKKVFANLQTLIARLYPHSLQVLQEGKTSRRQRDKKIKRKIDFENEIEKRD
jgi:GT2 family glycosyltransferase